MPNIVLMTIKYQSPAGTQEAHLRSDVREINNSQERMFDYECGIKDPYFKSKLYQDFMNCPRAWQMHRAGNWGA